MIRNAACLLVFAGLTLMASAQAQKVRLTALQQHELFKQNRAMIQSLVESSVEITNVSGDYLQRSKSYRKVVMKFQEELNNAAEGSDPGRVAELGEHLDSVLRQGLVPSMQKAARQAGPNGTSKEELQEMSNRTLELVNWLQEKATKKWPETPEVQKVIESLEKTKKELKVAGE
jgi:hypothetical protein